MKDRLDELKEGTTISIASDNEDEDDDDLEVLLPAEDEKIAAFLKEVEEVRDIINKVHETISFVKQKQSEILSAPQTDKSTHAAMQEAMNRIPKDANLVRLKMSNMAKRIDEAKHRDGPAPSAGISHAYARIQESQYATLMRKFMDVMTEYNAVQEGYRGRCKERLLRQLKITDMHYDEEKLEEMLENNTTITVFKGSMTLDMDEQETKEALSDIEARHDDIVKLEKSIKELHQLFMDMAIMVEQQGDMMDRIEKSVESAGEYVAVAAVDIKNAVEYQTKARKKCWIIIALLTVVAVIVAVVVAVEVSDSS